jgi:peptidoglycan/xylan/chitin deacetylase (PgdA/CDA1 family)
MAGGGAKLLISWPIAVVPEAAGVAAGMAAWGAIYPTSELFGCTVHHTARQSAIALTFDDGPNPAITPQLLELLDRHSVRATFFLIGRFARACPDIVREIAARGHMVGNHTETHAGLALLSPKRIDEELQRCQASIATALAGSSTVPAWMRPPFGLRGPQLAPAVRRAGLRGVVMGSKTCYDWRAQPPARLIARLATVSGNNSKKAMGERLGNSKGPIVLLHDGDCRQLGGDRQHVLAALEHWLPRWRDAGLEFVTMGGASNSA